MIKRAYPKKNGQIKNDKQDNSSSTEGEKPESTLNNPNNQEEENNSSSTEEHNINQNNSWNKDNWDNLKWG